VKSLKWNHYCTIPKASKLGFEPDETGSPVDLGCRIPAKYAFFDAEKQKNQKTEDWLAEGVEFELSGDS
jgi:hypothetical protein